MFSWHAIPFARVLIPFISGIVLSFYIHDGMIAMPLVFGISFLGLLILSFPSSAKTKFRVKILHGLLLSSCMLSLGYARTFFYVETRQQQHFSSIPQSAMYAITIDDAVVEKPKFHRCYARVTAVVDSQGHIHHAQGTVLMYFRKSHINGKPMVGEKFVVRGNASELSEPANPGQFNFKQYLGYRNIYYQLFSDSNCCIESSETEASIYRLAIIFRDKCLESIRRYLPSQRELGVAEALLLGYKDDLDPDITSAFSRTGTLHVLAVSGLHAGIIFLLISFLTRSLQHKKTGKWVQLILLLSGIWFYAFMTGLSSSVLRASVMFSIMSLGKILKHKPNIYNTLFASAFLLLLYNPFFIFDVGFQLSYLAVLGIVWIQPMIGKWYIPRNKVDKHIWELATVSLAAQVLTFPISLLYFNQFPNYFLLSNMLIIPLTTLILLGLILLLALSWLPILAIWTGKILHGMIWLSNWLVTGIDQLPYSFQSGLYLNLVQTILLYGIILFILAYILNKQKWVLFCGLFFCLAFTGTISFRRYEQEKQRVFIVHAIKGHDVFTCIEGRRAYIISEKGFLDDTNSIKFFLEPYLWKNGICDIHKIDMYSEDFFSEHLLVLKGLGLQFFDNIMTIQKPVQNTIQQHQIVLLKHVHTPLIKKTQNQSNILIISNNISKKETYKIKKEYFKLFHKRLEISKKALVFFCQ